MEEGGIGNIEVESMVVGDSTIGFVENANVGKGGSNVGTSKNEVEAIAFVMCVRGGDHDGWCGDRRADRWS